MQYLSATLLRTPISKLGLGTVKFGRNQDVKYPNAFTIPTDADLLQLLQIAADSGITLIDTAAAYGNSEQRLGSLLPQVANDWLVCTKAGEHYTNGVSHFDFSQRAITSSIERSLGQLKRDCIDIALIHSNGDDARIIDDYGVFATMQSLQRKGHIQIFGMSVKTLAGALKTCDAAGVVMLETNQLTPQDTARLNAHPQWKTTIVLAKKVLNSGHNLNIHQAFFQANTVANNVCIVNGTISPAHLRANVNAIAQL